MELLTKNLIFVLQCLLTVRANYPDVQGENVAETIVKIGNKLLNEPAAAVDASLLPGHLRPLGFGSVLQPIPVFNGFPKPQVFLGEYVVGESPVVLQRGALWLGQAFSSWNEETWLTSGFGLTTLVEVTKKSNNIKEIMSLRNFTKSLKLENAAIEMPVPDDLMRQTLVPRALLCDALSRQILDVVMRFHVGEESTPLRTSPNDVMLCQLGGARKLTLINPMTIPNKTSVLDQEGGLASGVDVTRVDMSKYASLSDAEIMVAHLKQSDCVYIPAKWLHTSRMYERDVSFSIVWQHKPVVPSQQLCGQKVPKTPNKTLADLPLINRPVATAVLPPTNFTLLHYFVDHYFKPTPVTPLEFEAQLVLDTVLFGQAFVLDMELKSVVLEIFSALDLNKDGHLCSLDWDTADFQALKAVSAALDASVQKLEALLLQQQAALEQLPSETVPVDEGTKVLVETYANELKRILEESLQELVLQQSAQEATGDAVPVETHKLLEKKAKSKLRKLIKKKQQPEPVVDEVVEEVVPEEEEVPLEEGQDVPIEEEPAAPRSKKQKVKNPRSGSKPSKKVVVEAVEEVLPEEEEVTLEEAQDVPIEQEQTAPRSKKQKFKNPQSGSKPSKKVARETVEPEVQPEEELVAEETPQVDQKPSKKQKGSKKSQHKQNTKSKKVDPASEQQAADAQEEVVDVNQEPTSDQHQQSKTKKTKGSKSNQYGKKEQGKNANEQIKNKDQSNAETTEQTGNEKQNVNKGRKDKTQQGRNEKVQKSEQSKAQHGKSEQSYNTKSEQYNGKSQQSYKGKNKNGASEQRSGHQGKKGKKDAGQNKEQKKSRQQSRVEL